MKKTLACIFVSTLAAVSLSARINGFGAAQEFGTTPPQDAPWYEPNTQTWDSFTSFDERVIFGLDAERSTMLQIEFYSTGVLEGRKVGGETLVASFQDRSLFFGGEGYMDLSYFAPVNPSKYAQQACFYGGWKYNIIKYLDIDLGGSVIYTTKKVMGPGIAGYGGDTWHGDVYVGFIGDFLWLSPFAYFDYDPTYDSKKFLAGFAPRVSLYELTKIKGLSLESQLTFGYVKANRFSGHQKIDGHYWSNDYGYIQAEVNLVYVFKKSWRTFIGVGWACHNDGKGKVGQGGVDMGPDQMVWGSCGIGYIF